MTSESLPGANNYGSLTLLLGGVLEHVVFLDEAARRECPAFGGDLLAEHLECSLVFQQLVACAPVLARLSGKVNIRVD